MTLYQNKFKIESAHLRGWNYASAGCYFITICTLGREKFHGKIVQS